MWAEYKEGLNIEWPFSFSRKEMLTFAKLSGDYNPIHSNDKFAKSKGFQSSLVYGLLLSSQFSRLIGEELPDNNSILTEIQINFLLPSFPGDNLIFKAILSNKSESTYSLEFKCTISKDNKIMCRGTANAVWRI